MKLKILALFAIAGTVFFAGCSKDDDSSKKDLKSYFMIEDATFVNEALPEESDSPTAPQILSLTGNTSIIEGGSNPIAISSASSFSDVLVSVEGTKGYFKIPPTSLRNASDVALYYIYLIIDQNLPREDFTIIFCLINGNGEVSSYEYLDVTTVEAGTGKLQISLSWNLDNDIDLHLIEPDGNEIYYNNPGGYDYEDYYSSVLGIKPIDGQSIWSLPLTAEQQNALNSITNEELKSVTSDFEGGWLDLDSNAGCSIDGVNNENITYATLDDIQEGTYIVRVDFYSDCVGSGTTNYAVTARFKGELINPSSSTNPFYGSFASGTADHGNAGSGVEVMRFSLSNVKSATISDNTSRVFKFRTKDNSEKASKMRAFSDKFLNSVR